MTADGFYLEKWMKQLLRDQHLFVVYHKADMLEHTILYSLEQSGSKYQKPKICLISIDIARISCEDL